ncbi:TetR/AcrR family transcriptional regulator [Spirillospora sp. CA-108201]
MRDRILAAAVTVIQARGITAATTKEIARTAGVSEGSLYNHFANKTALFAAALADVTGTARTAMTDLLASVGQSTVEENLTRLAAEMVRFYGELLPMTGPVLADPELIAWLRSDGPGAAQNEVAAKSRARTKVGQTGERPPPGGPPAGPATGPVMGHAALIGYLEAERKRGRLADGAPLPFIAAALLGGCQQHAFLTRLAGAETVAAGAGLPAAPEEFAARLVPAVLAGHLTPP